MNIVKKVKELGLPADSFIVVGSGTLEVLGFRPANDIDLLVTPEVYDKLKTAGWAEHTYASTLDNGLSHDVFEVVTNWHGIRLKELVKSAIWIDNIPFASLQDVISWKTTLARQKDLIDLALVKESHYGPRTTGRIT